MSRRQHGTCRAGGGRQHRPQPQRPPAAGLLLAPGRAAAPGPAGPNPAGSMPPPGTAFAPGPRAGHSKEAGPPCNAGTAPHPSAVRRQQQGSARGHWLPPAGLGMRAQRRARPGARRPEPEPGARQVRARGKPGPEGAGAGRGRARGRSGQRRAGPPHPVEVAGVAILPLRGQPLAERRDLADEQEGGGQQRGQRVVGPRQPAAQPGHRVQQRQQRRQHRHLGTRAHDRPLRLGRPPARMREAGLFTRWPMASGAVKHASRLGRPMRVKERSGQSEG